ncbi:MAG TPA: hypothetical protein VFX34_06030 [Sporosarcina sp.]|nr:hypothetical protein [Sporosarcina sp.]
MVIMSVGLQGMKGHKVAVEASVRVSRNQFVIVGSKLIRIARTITDSEGLELIPENTVQEAIKWKSMAPGLHRPAVMEGE